MNSVYIYVLIDPRTDEVRYVGKTIQKLNERLKCHCNEKEKSHKNNWIAELKKHKLKPIIKTIETCNDEDWPEREKYWIGFYKDSGCKMTNSHVGGMGGHIVNDDVRNKLRNIAILERDMRRERTRKHNSIKIKCVNTEEIFDSLSALASHLGMLPASISRLIKQNIPIKNNNYIFIDYNYDKTKHSKGIMRSDGKMYSSILSAANDMGINRKRIKDSISDNKTVSGFKYSYV